MNPSRDPNVPHPGKIFAGGNWRDPEKWNETQRRYEQSDKRRKLKRANHARTNPRLICMCAGGIKFYLGMAPTAEDAQYLRDKIRKEAPGGSSQQS